MLAGQRSYLSVPEAAALIVKTCRRHLQAFYGVPETDAIERGVRFAREAKEAWTQGGGRLASTLNYALVREKNSFSQGVSEPVTRIGVSILPKQSHVHFFLARDVLSGRFG